MSLPSREAPARLSWGSGCLVSIQVLSLFIIPIFLASLLWLWSNDWAGWWREWFGNPGFDLIDLAFRLTGERVVLTFGLIAMAMALTRRVLFVFPGRLMAWVSRASQAQNPFVQLQNELIAILRVTDESNLEEKSLRMILARPGATFPGPGLVAGTCCLSGTLILIAGPVWLCMNLALFDGLLRSYAPEDASTIGGSPLAAEADRKHVTVHERDSVLGIRLSERSWPLAATLGVVLLGATYVGLITPSGRTWPRGIGCLSLFVFLVGVFVCYLVLNGAILLYLTTFAFLETFLIKVSQRFAGRFSRAEPLEVE